MVTVDLGPLQALAYGANKTWEMSAFSLRMLGKMVMGSLSWKNLSGPVAIADYAGQSAAIGWFAYVGFMALISVSLGVLNLLPVPCSMVGVWYITRSKRSKAARFPSVSGRSPCRWALSWWSA